MVYPDQNKPGVLLIAPRDAFHDDLRTILGCPLDTCAPQESSSAGHLSGSSKDRLSSYVIKSAHEESESLAKVEQALHEQHPYAVAFVEKEPSLYWEGLQAAANLWQADPNLQMVLCTEQADQSRVRMTQRLGPTGRWLMIEEPFDATELQQITQVLAGEWALSRMMDDVEGIVQSRTADLQRSNDRLQDEIAQYPNSRKSIAAQCTDQPA